MPALNNGPAPEPASPIAAALRPAIPVLTAAVAAAALGGLTILGALWFTVQIVAAASLTHAIWACICWFIGGLLLSISSWLAHHGEAQFSARLRRDTARHLANMPMSTISRYGADALRRMVGEDIVALHHTVAHLPAEIATLAVVPLATTILLVTVAGPLALVALIPGLLAAAYYLFIVPRSSAKHGTETVRVMTDIRTAVDDYARGIRVSRIYSAQAGAAADYVNATRRFTENMVAWVRRVATLSSVAVALLQAVATYAIAYAIGYDQEPEVLTAMLLFGLAVVTPALRLGHGLDYVRAGRAGAERITAVLREPTVTGSTDHSDDPGLALIGVRIDQDDRTLIHNLSHTFPPGLLTAITGPSGSGKTTLLRAIAGLEKLERGAIQYPLREANSEKTASNSVLLIPQGGDVLAGTIRENIGLSTPEATDDAMSTALRRAQLDLPLDTATTTLSGGERQRVGLARAFLTDAPVILLDEPTSALDDETGRRLVSELRAFAAEESKTLLIVTHDHELVEDATAHLKLTGNSVTVSGGIR